MRPLVQLDCLGWQPPLPEEVSTEVRLRRRRTEYKEAEYSRQIERSKREVASKDEFTFMLTSFRFHFGGNKCSCFEDRMHTRSRSVSAKSSPIPRSAPLMGLGRHTHAV